MIDESPSVAYTSQMRRMLHPAVAACVFLVMPMYEACYAQIINAEAIGYAASQSGPNWATFDQVLTGAIAGDDGIDRAFRAFFVFNVGSSFKATDTAFIALSQASATISTNRPDGVPLSLNFYQANDLGSVSPLTGSQMWSAIPLSSVAYTYPLANQSLIFTSNISSNLLLASPNDVNPFVWVSVQISDPNAWFPAPNRNQVSFSSSLSANQISIVPEPSTYMLFLLAGAGTALVAKLGAKRR